MAKMTKHYKQTNHVILAQCHGRQSLLDVFKQLGFGKYRPKTYSALTQRFINPKATMIIFSTGNITNMGCKTFFGAMRVLLNVKKKLQLDIINIKLTNIVINFSFKDLGPIDLDKFYEENRGVCTYDPRIFPCLTYGIPDTKIKANIFDSGNVVITGCKNRECIQEAVNLVMEKIKSCIN